MTNNVSGFHLANRTAASIVDVVSVSVSDSDSDSNKQFVLILLSVRAFPFYYFPHCEFRFSSIEMEKENSCKKIQKQNVTREILKLHNERKTIREIENITAVLKSTVNDRIRKFEKVNWQLTHLKIEPVSQTVTSNRKEIPILSNEIVNWPDQTIKKMLRTGKMFSPYSPLKVPVDTTSKPRVPATIAAEYVLNTADLFETNLLPQKQK